MSGKNNNMKAEELGARIREEIKLAGMKQSEFAAKLGLTPSRLSNYISGSRLPDIFVLNDIAECLGLSVDYLCCGGQTNREFPRRYLLTVFESGKVKLSEPELVR